MLAKPTYERMSFRLPDGVVAAALARSEESDITGKVVEWRDEKTVGLTLRITRRKVVWYVRRREVTLRLGTAADIPLEDARYYADRIRLAAGRHRDLRAFVGNMLVHRRRDDVDELVDQHPGKQGRQHVQLQYEDERDAGQNPCRDRVSGGIGSTG